MPLIMETDEKRFPFTSLLPKLRQRIYEYVLVSPTPVEIHEAQRRRKSSVSRGARIENPGSISALLRVNRQIRREAAPLFFSKNTFIIPWGFPNLGCCWLESLAPQHRQALQDVRFCYGDGAFWSVYDARTALSALQYGLKRSGVSLDLKELQMWLPVSEFSVHTWKELYGRDDAQWVSVDEVRRFQDGKKVEYDLRP